jgi:hypothetical protein
MEKTTPFDLNHAIKRWRETLAQSPAFRSENLDELETHLRDSVVDLQSRGLSPGEAFVIATKRVGNNEALEREFGRVNGKSVWLDRVLWMLIGIQVWGLASGLMASIARTTFALGWQGIDYNVEAGGMALPVSLFGLVQVLALAASIGLCWWLIFLKGGAFHARVAPWLQRRATFVACCIAFSVLAVLVKALSSSLTALLVWSSGPKVVGEAMLYSSYSELWVTPFQFAALVAATLVVARRRLSPGWA